MYSHENARFEALTVVLKNHVFLDVMLCHWASSSCHFAFIFRIKQPITYPESEGTPIPL